MAAATYLQRHVCWFGLASPVQLPFTVHDQSLHHHLLCAREAAAVSEDNPTAEDSDIAKLDAEIDIANNAIQEEIEMLDNIEAACRGCAASQRDACSAS